MKKIVVALLFLNFALSLSAQRVYFVYLQSEKQVPFYVKMGDRVHSSTFSGYLILSSLKDSTYSFSLGYPGKAAGESKFNVVVSNNDKGYLIKDLEDGVTLFDLQNLTLLRPVSASVKSAGQQTALRTDPFTKLLSQTSDDASLLTASVVITETQKEVAPPEEKKDLAKEEEKVTIPPVVETTKVEKREDTKAQQDTALLVEKKVEVKPEIPVSAAVKEKVAADTVEKQPIETAAPAEEVFVRSVVTRRSESSTTEGFGLVFLDNQGGVIDTIRLLIPSSKIQLREEEPTQQPEATAAVVVTPSPALVPDKSVETSASLSNCVSVASDKDFLKLRKNMAAEVNEERMLSLARKQFRTKCYTTEQVKNLSSLFLSSASKYQFFDLAFPNVSDRATFASLEAELKEDYYVKRFKALIGE